MTWRDLKENRAIELVSGILHIGTIGIALSSYAVAIAITYFYIPSIKSALLGGTIAAASTILLYSIFVKIRNNRKFKQTDWNPWIYTSSRKTTVIVKSPSDIVYRSNLKLKFLNHDISRLNWRMGWSGEGDIEIFIKNKDFQSEIEPSLYDISKVLRIYFNRPMNKGEKLDLEFEIRTKATTPAKPFYSVTCFDSKPPRDMAIDFHFSENVDTHSVQKSIYASDTAAWPMAPPESLELDTHRAVLWKVSPVYGHRYCVSWEYLVGDAL